MGSPSPAYPKNAHADSKHGTGRPPRGYRLPRQRRGSGTRSPRGRGLPANLPAVAHDAVVTYMYEAERAKEAEVTTTEAEVAATGETQPALPTALAAVGEETAQDVAVRAAEVSLMTLDRIEAAAAKLEVDIAAARSEQARLQAGAAKAAADAIKAAQAAWTSAGSAEESSQRARVSARVVFGYLIIAAILVVIQLFIVLIFATSAH
jgi:hypothetical protein